VRVEIFCPILPHNHKSFNLSGSRTRIRLTRTSPVLHAIPARYVPNCFCASPTLITVCLKTTKIQATCFIASGKTTFMVESGENALLQITYFSHHKHWLEIFSWNLTWRQYGDSIRATSVFNDMLEIYWRKRKAWKTLKKQQFPTTITQLNLSANCCVTKQKNLVELERRDVVEWKLAKQVKS